MKFDSNCKAIIESMNYEELEWYIRWLKKVEIPRHKKDITKKHEANKWIRSHWRYLTDHRHIPIKHIGDKVYLRLNQTAIYRHRQDIQGTRECILRAEDRMEMLEFLS